LLSRNPSKILEKSIPEGALSVNSKEHRGMASQLSCGVLTVLVASVYTGLTLLVDALFAGA
jgi:3-deoxy-D-arabino-heptulosonate 7-phosphate (DAHP) synthase